MYPWWRAKYKRIEYSCFFFFFASSSWYHKAFANTPILFCLPTLNFIENYQFKVMVGCNLRVVSIYIFYWTLTIDWTLSKLIYLHRSHFFLYFIFFTRFVNEKQMKRFIHFHDHIFNLLLMMI